MSVQHKQVKPEDDGQRIDRWLKRYFPAASMTLIQKTLRKGEIRVNKGRVKASTRLSSGDDVRIPPQFTGLEKPAPKVTSSKDKDFIRSLVLYEDSHIVALNKPSGLAVQGGSKTTRHIDGMLDGLKKKESDPRPKLVHRLDKETSGVLVLAKTPEAARHLMAQFKGKEIQKTYIAITAPAPSKMSGELRGALVKKTGGAYERVVIDEDEGKRARTIYEVVDKASRSAALVAFQPLTGRTHQIRVHTSEILKAPILGDIKYGYDKEGFEALGIPNNLHLHALEILIPKLSGRGLWEIKAPLPEGFKESCKNLGLTTKFNNPFNDANRA